MALRFWIAICVGALGCASAAVDWRNHASFRTSGAGADVKVAQIEPGEHVKAGISQNVHYVALSLDAVFFRDLPGLRDRSVVMGIDVDGVIADRRLRGVIDVKESVSKHAFLSFDNSLMVEPFLYNGRPLTITLHFRAVPKADVPVVREATLARLGAKLDPLNRSIVDLASEKFTQVLGAIGGSTKTWSYSFTLFPPDTTYKDKPEMLLTATRHVLLAVPPADAPKKLRDKLNPYKLVERLKMRANRLVDAATGEEYVESPYIVLNVTRFKRYPKKQTPLAKAVQQADTFIEQRNLEMAAPLIRTIAVEINNDNVLTTKEKNLERARNEIREVTIQAENAEHAARAKEHSRLGMRARIDKLDAQAKAVAASKAAAMSDLADLERKKETKKRLKMRLAIKERVAALENDGQRLAAERASFETEIARPWEDVLSRRTRQLKLLSGLLAEHAPILEPYEIEETDGQIRRLATRTEALLQQLARDVGEVKVIVAELDRRIQDLKKADESQSKEISDLKKKQTDFEREMRTRFDALATSEANRVRDIYTPKWYEKGWVWSLITVGVLGATGAALYFTVFKKGYEDTTPTAWVGGLTTR